eukprot:3571293-Prymnesium_polylepis.2
MAISLLYHFVHSALSDLAASDRSGDDTGWTLRGSRVSVSVAQWRVGHVPLMRTRRTCVGSRGPSRVGARCQTEPAVRPARDDGT